MSEEIMQFGKGKYAIKVTKPVYDHVIEKWGYWFAKETAFKMFAYNHLKEVGIKGAEAGYKLRKMKNGKS